MTDKLASISREERVELLKRIRRYAHDLKLSIFVRETLDDAYAALSVDERLIEALEWWDRQATSWLGTREEHARPGWMQPAIEKGRDALSTTKADQP